MKHSIRYTGASVIVAALVWSTVHVTSIRGAAPVAETWTVYSGEIIEIMPLHDIQDAKYGWVLIKDAAPNEPESFLEGGTAKTFRYRPIQPGSYTLYGDIASADGSRHIQRGFRFAVMPKMQDPPLPVVEGDGPKLVGTEPKIAADGTVTMRDDQQLLRLIPLDSQRRNIAIDTDITVDADGDGNLSNDIENTNTFFQSTATPLYLWFASPQLSDRTIVLTAARADGQGGEEQRVRALSFDFARDNSLLTSSVTIAAQIGTGGTVRFRANLDASFPIDETPVLYRWAFGDGEESLETEPVHTYAAPGQFTVSLQIRNLSNGKEVGGSSTQLTIMPPPVTSSAASSSAESVSSEAPADNGGTSGGSMRMILIGGAVLLVSLIVGAGVVFLLSRLRKGSSLDAHLAKMEQNIVNKEKAKLLDTTAPVAIKSTATVVPDAKPVDAAQGKPAQAPAAAASTTVDANKAPAWLKKGLAGQTTTATVTTPAAAPVPPKPAAPAPAPAAQPPKAPQTPAPAADAALPDWLKTPPAPAPAATPAPSAAAASASAASVDEKLPDWLKTPAPAAATPTQTPAPVAPPVAAPAPAAPKAPEAPKSLDPSQAKPFDAAQGKPVSTPAAAPAPVAAVPVKQPEAPKPTPAPAPAPVQPPKADAPKAAAPTTPAPAPKAPEAPKAATPAPAAPKVEPKPFENAQGKPQPAQTPAPVATPAPNKPVVVTPAPAAAPAPAQTVKADAPKPAATMQTPAPVPAPKAPDAPKPFDATQSKPVTQPAAAPAPSAPVKPPEAPKPATPAPAAPKIEPKPVTPPTPAPAPVAPKPAESPQGKPAEAAPQSAPVPTAPKPVAAPAPAVPSPAPTPTPQPKPVETAQAKPLEPAAKPVPQDIPLAEETIAVIRAESLNPSPSLGANPPAPTANPPEPPKPQA